MEQLVGNECRAIGVSNFSVKNLEILLKDAQVVPAVDQVITQAHTHSPVKLTIFEGRVSYLPPPDSSRQVLQGKGDCPHVLFAPRTATVGSDIGYPKGTLGNRAGQEIQYPARHRELLCTVTRALSSLTCQDPHLMGCAKGQLDCHTQIVQPAETQGQLGGESHRCDKFDTADCEARSTRSRCVEQCAPRTGQVDVVG